MSIEFEHLIANDIDLDIDTNQIEFEITENEIDFDLDS